MDPDIAVILLIILGILSCVVIYGNAGSVGETLGPFLGGCLGRIKYIIPIAIFGAAFAVTRDEGKFIKSKIFQILLLLGFVSSCLTIYQMSVGNIDKTKGFDSVMQAAYQLGILNKGGGTIGAVIAYPLVSLFSEFGAAVVSLGLTCILGVFTFGFSPSNWLLEMQDRMEESKEQRQEELEERKALRAERRKARRSLDVSLDEEEPGKKKKNSRLEKELEQEEELRLQEEQIKMNLGELENSEETPKKEGKIKGLFRHKDGSSEIVENGQPQEAKSQNPNDLSGLFVEKTVEKEEKTQEILQLEHNMTTEDDENYEFPPLELMKQGNSRGSKGGNKALSETALKLQKTLHSFGVSAKVENYSVGPAITRFELKPAEGVRVSKIAKLADDIALNLAAETIRIEAPIPGKQAVGIEIPNTQREIVPLRDVLESDTFQDASSKVSMALGKDIAGDAVVADISKMPHMLIAGSTGSGKSVCVNSLITSILYKAKPSEVKLLMVDPKVVELSVYNGIPHLLIPVVTDPKKAAGALAWAVQEMENRYASFAKQGVRDLKGYNHSIQGTEHRPMPQIVIIVDELADLMMVAAKDVEDAICRLAQKARAAGMHLVIATQRPSVDVITGLIKANVPSRIAFAVSSQIDSRTILDMAGAEKLLGKGDMLFYPIGASKPVRVQGAFVSDEEVENIVGFIKSNGTVTYNEDIIEQIESSGKSDKEKDEEIDDEDDADPFLNDAIESVIEIGQASTSFIQRRFKVGYARAGRIIDQMEARGIISGYAGSKPREVLITKERWQELNMSPSQVANNTNDEDLEESEEDE
ncbi:MAG: DUF87 domain-containing protein [Clostridia bacterium]|nr:DUF87 domain-containing protein [Clostridia bacterium]